MKAELTRTGDEFVIRIPAGEGDRHGLADGQTVEILPRRRKETRQDMRAGMDRLGPAYRPPVVDWGRISMPRSSMTTCDDVRDIAEAGDLVCVDLRPTPGRERSGSRPALVPTSREFHARNATAIVCPVTRNIDPWPTKAILPPGLVISGATLTDQIRSVDRAARGSRRIDGAPVEILDAVRQKICEPARVQPAFLTQGY
ncbi:type II toxin-antitoxin system PemK/MazF family toxin [Methylobacterium sp. NEAU K]|uniref:type II toxin-antitoxin system PemK/MazF family toxin n=1 Tax=Methylobacterium sp. NEAU K TaxID=3064946 RepID=UPI0027373B25|nr:type II toxin-antitoxin system PemK/MazF family toxin [Methylobacterium sp. NEAU K]MDP4004510.1 type II toxin-antitoxin system PemK/MazF family toxin [Methylobacterium sp. NEAU K]